MMWDQIIERAIAKLKQNSTIVDLFGDNIRMAGPGKLQVPSLEYTILTDIVSEVWTPILVQWDIWTDKAVDNRAIERIIRSLFDQRVPVIWDDLLISSDYVQGSHLATPDRANYIGRGLQFRMQALKQQHAQPTH